MAINLDGYIDVATRLRLALEAHPDLRIREEPPAVVEWAGNTVLVCTVTVWRAPDDPIPTNATATEPYPGRTPYTKDSEVMVGMTSALGRALGYMGFGSQHSIASADEVQAARSRTPATTASSATSSTPPARAQLGANVPSEPASPQQYAKLRALGHPGTETLTKRAASQLIDAITRGADKANTDQAGQ